MYRETTPVDERRRQCNDVLHAYPRRCPVIIEPASAAQPPIGKRKFIVPGELQVSHLLSIVRKRVRLHPSESLFLFTEAQALPTMSDTVATLYSKSANAEDGFLYLTYARQDAFG
jgi:microtubule-associated protein 1 light chain